MSRGDLVVDLLASAFRGVLSFLLWLWASRDQLRVAILGATLLVALSNLYFFKRVERYGVANEENGEAHTISEDSLPFVSVLVPARNEERNIEACVTSLLGQRYPRFEVLVLDDDSTDETPVILSRLEQSCRRLRVLRGQPLPDDWLGKHWACHQLALAAQGDLLLFVDADTRHHPLMLREAVAAQAREESDLLTGLPHEETVTLGERLVIPIIGWAVLALLPLGLAHRLKSALLSMGIGQFMLFRRAAFWAVGGFVAVRQDPVDDMALARRTKRNGLCWRFLDLSGRVSCRMYQGFKGAADGLGKSVFPALGRRLAVLAGLFVLLAWMYLAPLAECGGWLLGMTAKGGAPFWAGLAVGLAFATWTLVMWRTKQPFRWALTYPLIIGSILGIAVRSAYLFKYGKASWKGRTLPALPGETPPGRAGRPAE